jgi:hypothetical protein
MPASVLGVKVFSAMPVQQRADLGERVTDYEVVIPIDGAMDIVLRSR